MREYTPRSEEEDTDVGKEKPDLPQGTLDMLVLKTLSLLRGGPESWRG